MKIDYNHSTNLHTEAGPRAVLPTIIAQWNPKSILDVGCGTGTWLKVAESFGVSDFVGVDGVDTSGGRLLIPPSHFVRQDLTTHWSLQRTFDLALCLEVAEHLDEIYAGLLIETLTSHANTIVFSAACPGQEGQHHVNCQWPAYWQQFFNQNGFVCDDQLRWQIWDDERVEPWYRQNILTARRAPSRAGQELRLKAVIHPQIWSGVTPTYEDYLRQIEEGSMTPAWYATLIPHAVGAKLKRHLQS